MFRLIGGPARCGKTTLTQKAQERYQEQLLSLDNLRRSYLAVSSEEQRARLEPADDVETHSAQEWLAVLRKRDRLLWLGVKAYLAAAAELKDDVLVEGCLWPDYVGELGDTYRAVFLVDTSEGHVGRVIAAAKNQATQNNWMRERSDAWLRKWAEYNRKRSKLYVELAGACRQPVFDVGEIGFEAAQAAALDYLFPADET